MSSFTFFSINRTRKYNWFLCNSHLQIFILITALSIFSGTQITAQTHTVTYMENSDHELTIYYINGKESGKTMMIIGGIQGDEPGGYLAADLYADMLLEKGNLIVVPRANFNSIKQNTRGVNGDMNRKFSANSSITYDNDLDIVDILKSLIQKSDVLLNLHDGSGFYYPEHISEIRNPMRYGQSIIADASRYSVTEKNVIDLESPAKRVIAKVNQNIKNNDHLFRFNNHNTLSKNSKHKEQRKSATFYALTEAGIPAFGAETSKDIKQVEIKVKYQTLIINAFMAEYEIIPEHPSVFLPVPELDHLVINIPGYPNPFAVENGDMLSLPPGTSIHVSSVVANYKRGISIDILGVGNTNDMDRVTVINSPTRIQVYKDAYLCGEVKIDTTSELSIQSPGRLKQIEINIGNKNVVVSESDTLHIIKGDIIKIVNAWTAEHCQSGFRINFEGFVGNKKVNDAEDRGYTIDTALDLMNDWSIDDKRALYRIVAESLPSKKIIGMAYIALDEPEIDYLILERIDGTKLALPPGSVLSCGKNERVKVLSIISNITVKPFVDIFAFPMDDQMKKLVLPVVLEMSSELDIHFRRASNDLGSISFRIEG